MIIGKNNDKNGQKKRNNKRMIKNNRKYAIKNAGGGNRTRTGKNPTGF